MKTGYMAVNADVIGTLELLYTDEGEDKSFPVSLANEENGIVGMCIVYRTKTAARKACGKDVELMEVKYEEKK